MKFYSLTKLFQNYRTPILIAGGVLLTGAIGLAGATQLGWLKPGGEVNKALAELTVEAKREKLMAKVKASGTVTPRQTVNVSPKSAGRVMKLMVEQGDAVVEGQELARMDSSDLEGERNQALAAVASAQARLQQLRSPNRSELVRQAENEVDRSQGDVFNAGSEISNAKSEIIRSDGLIADARAGLALAERQYKRNLDLRAEGAISINALDEFERKLQGAQQTLRQTIAQRDQAQEKVRQANARRVQAEIQVSSKQEGLTQQEQSGSDGDIAVQESQVEEARARLRAVETRIEDTIVRAPFSGLVTQRYASVGAFVTPTTQASASATGGATSTSIVAIASALEVLAKIPEIDIGQVKVGLGGEMVVDAFPSETFKATVRLIAPEAIEERDVRFFQVRLKLLSGQRKLKSGMNVDIEFAGPESEALLVPTVAIVTKKGRPGVLVPDEKGNPKFKPVTVGTTQSGRSRGKSQDNGGDKSGGKGSVGKTQITEGLKEGDRVFINLPEGQKLDQLLKDEKDKK
ncbi:MAG: efflux RND transporter periplasmic adaptor subunit [Cyanobacteria bacterium]|nr:efflux RND transporter periplasmic adaptor subunit [Cyanobacteriota bacterium]